MRYHDEIGLIRRLLSSKKSKILDYIDQITDPRHDDRCSFDDLFQ
jgi:hypothetical protein